MTPLMSEEARPSGFRPGRVGLFLLLILAILILGDLNRRMVEARRLERDAAMLATEVASLETEQAVLQTQVAGATSEAAVGAWARSEARMVQPGERLVVPLPASGPPPTPTPEASAAEPPPSPWQVWWALFFGP